MAREVLYRRSFHSDRDLKGMETSLLGMDRMMAARKVSVDMRLSTTDGGYEAPRNSLDVPFSGLLEMRRNSEVRNEEIPIGYELSRSLTTRRRPEEYSTLKPLSSANDPTHWKSKHSMLKVNPELDQKNRAPSVVARLMGLDGPPRQEKGDSPKHSALRRIEGTASSDVPALASERDVWGEQHSKQKPGYGELSFRHHPQEKQLQEFKREFKAQQAHQGRHSMSSLNVDQGFTLQQEREELLRSEPQMDSEEFLDALNFLNANKDFFVKVLNDPHSSFAKHLQQPGGSFASSDNGLGRQLGGKLTRSSLECDSPLFANDLAEWKMKQDLHQNAAIADKSKAVHSPRWGHDEEMPGRSRWRARGGSLLSAGRMGPDRIVPTRIVVLKPNLGKLACRTPPSSTSSSPRLHHDGILRTRFQGKENLKQEVKERTQLQNNVELAREYHRDDIKDRSKDVHIIAKQIVKHVKEETTHRLLKNGPYTVDPFAPVNCLIMRKAAAAQKGGGNASSLTDNGKICSNLPSLSNLSKIEREREHRQVGFNGKRGSYTDDSKRGYNKNLMSSSTKSFRDSSKLDEGMQGNQESCSKQSVRESKSLKKTGRSSSFKVRDSKCEVPRVLSRSLSAPAAASMENRPLEGEQKGGTMLEPAICLSRARPAENSPFKERLLSLKDSFSLTKRRGKKKPSSPLCSSPPDLTEVYTSRQLTLGQVGAPVSLERKQPCHLLPGYEWDTDSSAIDAAKAALEKSLDAVLSDTSLTPSRLQWPSNADVADNASETSLDKCEQPSPVSVLETPFQEESPSSVDKREMDSHGHELRCGDYKDFRPILHVELLSQPSLCDGSFDCLVDKSLNTRNLPEAVLESHRPWQAACISGTEEELTYIMRVLSLSGLNMNELILAHSLSSEHGLSPSVFGSLEAYYQNRSKGGIEDDVVPPLSTSSRRLLFDVVDEVVASTMKRRTLLPWAYGKSSNRKVVLCTGKQLLDEILAHISYHRYVPCEAGEEFLEDMASKDLMREAPWVPLHSDTRNVVTELEWRLCDSLIREIVCECKQR